MHINLRAAIPAVLRLALLFGIGVVCTWIAWFPVGMGTGGAPNLMRPLFWHAMGSNFLPLIVVALMNWFLAENRRANLVALLSFPLFYNTLVTISIWG